MKKINYNDKVHIVHDGDYLQGSLPKANNTPPPPKPQERSLPEAPNIQPPPKPRD